MSIDIVPLANADISGAVECVQKAFADDPYFRWAFNNPSKFNVQRNAASLAAHFQYGINCGCPISVAKVSQAAGDRKTDHALELPQGSIVGVSWWYPPQPAYIPQTWSVWAQDWLLSFRQLLNNIRFLGRGGSMPHDTGSGRISVSSEARGMGVGKRLMESVMAKADQENMPCYLESSKGQPNVTIYEKMGFQLVKEIECAEGGDVCRLYCMIRNPKSKN
ncbi:hypothetical protein N7462_008846 [Penicillium macrosclerotiorum]|uniref:uncharacterized protein n=1 Tax=Penicillium macrosclerotiorum TaxID=303699 RepID=UPI0025494BF8|nr:uncharacterized protein N7462_008846 [Penicillium macrosclerotiorum]KAJ5675949.1 hypothetical protein N7462_008846 [Penicillium macrosclerotiorum]